MSHNLIAKIKPDLSTVILYFSFISVSPKKNSQHAFLRRGSTAVGPMP